MDFRLRLKVSRRGVTETGREGRDGGEGKGGRVVAIQSAIVCVRSRASGSGPWEGLGGGMVMRGQGRGG